MLNKKSPKASLEGKKSIALLMGLVIALSVLYIALEWSSKKIPVYMKTEIIVDSPVIFTIPATPPPSKPVPPPPKGQISKWTKPDVIIGGFNAVDSVNVIDSARVTKAVNNPDPIYIPTVPTDPEVPAFVVFLPDEDMPKFRKGNLREYINKRIRYPEVSQRNGISGTVFCEFIIGLDGSVEEIKIVKSVDPDLDKEVIRVVQELPKWTPGRQNGKPVRVKQTIPVKFAINR